MCEALISLPTSEDASGEITVLLVTSPEVSNWWLMNNLLSQLDYAPCGFFFFFFFAVKQTHRSAVASAWPLIDLGFSLVYIVLIPSYMRREQYLYILCISQYCEVSSAHGNIPVSVRKSWSWVTIFWLVRMQFWTTSPEHVLVAYLSPPMATPS